MNATLRIIRYVKATLGQGILLSSKGKDVLTTHCDAVKVKLVSYVVDRQSQTSAPSYNIDQHANGCHSK